MYAFSETLGQESINACNLQILKTNKFEIALLKSSYILEKARKMWQSLPVDLYEIAIDLEILANFFGLLRTW